METKNEGQRQAWKSDGVIMGCRCCIAEKTGKSPLRVEGPQPNEAHTCTNTVYINNTSLCEELLNVDFCTTMYFMWK